MIQYQSDRIQKVIAQLQAIDLHFHTTGKLPSHLHESRLGAVIVEMRLTLRELAENYSNSL